MDTEKRKRLEKTGWKSGSVQDFLGLSDKEITYIDLKIDLSHLLKAQRTKKGLTQQELANRLGSSQSRVAKMENGDPGVSVDLLIKALLEMDTDRKRLATAIG
jgi:DNA-binding XRE family transcriptional regulator